MSFSIAWLPLSYPRLEIFASPIGSWIFALLILWFRNSFDPKLCIFQNQNTIHTVPVLSKLLPTSYCTCSISTARHTINNGTFYRFDFSMEMYLLYHHQYHAVTLVFIPTVVQQKNRDTGTSNEVVECKASLYKTLMKILHVSQS